MVFNNFFNHPILFFILLLLVFVFLSIASNVVSCK
nr:MAG TPA: hypothetical protein [Caudoviricetes sp.]